LPVTSQVALLNIILSLWRDQITSNPSLTVWS
jgi:hypothetical protein